MLSTLALTTNTPHRYSRTRIQRGDGSFYDVVEVIASEPDNVEFHKGIDAPLYLKLRDIAQLRMLKALSRGVSSPLALVWEAYGHEETVGGEKVAIDLTTPGQGTELVHVSKNSKVTHYLRSLVLSRNYVVTQGCIQVKDLRTEQDVRTQNLLDSLYAEGRIVLVQDDPSLPLKEIYENFDAFKDVIAVGRIGLPSLYSREEDYPIVFNTSFFLLEEEDFISEFSLLGDAYSLQIRDGIIESPPIFNRSALLFPAGGEVVLRQISFYDLKLEALDRIFDLANFTLNEPSEYAIYTRYLGVVEAGRTSTRTPRDEGKIEFIIIDRSIVGFKRGGETEIPHNGFVLSLPVEDLEGRRFSNEVSYMFADGSSFRAGIQCGPGLLENGEVILDSQRLKQEEFFRKILQDGNVSDLGVVPTDYAEDIDETRAARVAIGVDFEGRFRVLAVEAVNRGMSEETGESSGATLSELASVLKDRGYKHALNVDGGGSGNIQYYYGHLVKGADRRGLPGITYERFVPSVGVIRR